MPEKRPTILITGAGSGLGRGLAQHLANVAGRLILTDLSGEAAQQTLEHVSDACAGSAAFALDVSSAASIAELMQILGDERIDVLINNAGMQFVSPVEEFPEERWDKLLDVMLKGSFLMCQAVLPRMRRNGFGRLINIGSIHSAVASPFKSAYVAAKHGLVGLVKTLALETGNADITANIVCPSYIRTPLVDSQIKAQAKANGISEQEVIDKIMLDPMPKKVFVTVEEVAATVRFLMSHEARNITGQSILIDGGWTAR